MSMRSSERRSRGWWASIAVLAFSIVQMVGHPAKAETTLIYNVTVSKFHPFFRGAQAPWKKAVERATNNEVKVEFPAASLASQRRQWGMVTSDVADVAISNSGFQSKRLLLPAISHLPFTTSNAVETSVALWRTYQKFFANANEFSGVKLLSLFVHSGSQIFTRERQINRVEDFEGMKIRTSAGLATELFKRVGAVPVPSSGPQIFEFTSKGIIDGLAVGFAAVGSFKIEKYLDHAIEIPGTIGNVSWGVIMNQDKWNSLPEVQQKAIISVSGEMLSRSAGQAWDDDTAKSMTAWKASGKKVTQANPSLVSQLKQRFAFAEKEWLTDAASRGVDGKAALAYFRAQAGVPN